MYDFVIHWAYTLKHKKAKYEPKKTIRYLEKNTYDQDKISGRSVFVYAGCNGGLFEAK